MGNDYLQHKAERDRLHEQLSKLQEELRVEKDNVDYYSGLLRQTRSKMLVIMNMVDAKTQVPDNETEDESWDRLFCSIIDKLRSE